MDNRLKITPTPLAGVMVVETLLHVDERGHFYRAFCQQELAPILDGERIEQINLSHTVTAGTLRGMHFQRHPHSELKLIRCMKGRIWDVAVDLRGDSPTFLQWYAIELNKDNRCMLAVPKGCAHGFQTLEADCGILYLHTARYNPESEGGIRFDDPLVSIQWPLPPAYLSERDRSYPLLESHKHARMIV